MGRYQLLLRGRKVMQAALHQYPFINHQTQLCSASSSTVRDKYSADPEYKKKGSTEGQPEKQDRVTRWTPRQRRSSLSPSARLFAALSEESQASQHTSVISNEEKSDLKADQPAVHNVASHCSAQSRLSENAQQPWSPNRENSEERQTQAGYNLHLRRRHLSPLKRFSEMIPEKYWDESNISSSEKQDLDSLIKSDDSSKK